MHTVQSSILIKAPAAECYRRWMNFERFPEFMPRVISVRRVDAAALNVESVPPGTVLDPQKDYDETMTVELAHEIQAHGNQIWRWEVRGPMNQTAVWTAGIVHQEENKSVSWASPYNEELPTSGTVNFLPQTGNAQTLVEVKMTYSAPGVPFGELVTDMLQVGDTIVGECLQDFKDFVEADYRPAVEPATKHDATREPIKSEEELRKTVGVPGAERSAAEQQAGRVHADNQLMPPGATEEANLTPSKE